MDRWEIRSEPSADDPQRHVLLLKGGMTDIAQLVRKFGAMCGRPTPHSGGGYNLSLVLHKVTPAARASLDAWLEKAAPGAAGAGSGPAPGGPLPPMPVLNSPQTAPPSPTPPVLVPPPTMPSVPVPPPAAPPMPPIPTAGRSEPPPTKPELPGPSIVTPTPGVPVSEMPKVHDTPQPPPPTLTRPPDTAPPVATPPPPSPLSEALREDWTLETLQVGAYNRFAHAAATSVVNQPGTMYNPLFLYGTPGTGKSRLLHAIANAMSKGLGESTFLLTSGARLSRAVTSALARGSTADIDAKVKESRALFIDDIHLMAVNDGNKEALARVFKAFFDDKRQVVITSLYPPKALGRLEESLKFSFAKGWSVDLKIPGPNVQKDLIMMVCDKAGMQLSQDEGNTLHEKLSHIGYSELSLWASRLALLRDKRESRGEPVGVQDLLSIIYEPVVGGVEGQPTQRPPFTQPPVGADAQPIAVIAPKARDGVGSFAASLFYEVGGNYGFAPAYRHVLFETYDDQQQVGVPFQIADMCHRAAVTRALIIGPTPESALGTRAAEFAHAVRHLLESVGVRTGWIPASGLYTGAHYLNAHLDFNKRA